MTKDKLLNHDPDWVDSPANNNSLTEMVAKYPNGVPVKLIAKALGISSSEVEEIHDSILESIREKFND